MRKMRDFKCEVCGLIHESLVYDEVKELDCPECGIKDASKRQLSAPSGSGNAAHGYMHKQTGVKK
ncbi:hypothetical protein pEaSNUABM56_00089 [Erwinia phage pEa_SNUABM_56]|nr:hypothetical protein pEaSNUABM55_00021 [Erwinia phage pEa_SNUABM_55]UYL85134.1 hypothetical protein pEaSNUABM56_00089 [Erwinia phage pEa_SNUABM_56]